MINGNGVHLPDTTYGGNPINWNCSSDSDDSLQRLKAENAKLRELVEYMHRCFVRGHDWGPYCEGETVWVEQRMRELGVEVDG